MLNWLVVRNILDLPLAMQQLNSMLIHSWGQTGTSSAFVVQGVWIDPCMVTQPPVQLSAPTHTKNDRQLNICEMIGLAGVWQLFRLEAPDMQHDSACKDILMALIHHSRRSASPDIRQIIPVIPVVGGCCTSHEDIGHVLAIAKANKIDIPAIWIQDLSSGHCRSSDDYYPIH